MKAPSFESFARLLVPLYLLLGGAALAATTPGDGDAPAAAPGEVLVVFKPNIGAEAAKTVLARHSLQWTEHYDRLADHRKQPTGLVRSQDRDTARLIEQLQADPEVEAVEPDYIRRVSAVTPDDAEFPKLWGLADSGQVVNGSSSAGGADIRFIPAWKLARPDTSEVVVAVIDTGMDIAHPDLVGNLWTNSAEIPGNGIDDDGDGYIDDVHGYDFASGTATMTDSGEHGTHVAGTIAATGKNGIGVIGVDWRARLLPLKVSTDGETMRTSAVLAAYNYAITLRQRGVNLVAINASFGGASASTSERLAIEALRDAGIILCAAAGNESGNNDTTPSYPASYTTSNIISVAALDRSNGLASFSNYGATSVDIAAPGTDIYSAMPSTALSATSSVRMGSTDYAAAEIEYAGLTGQAGVTGAVYNCGLGNPAQFPVGLTGYVALIQRGTLNFSTKVANAMAAGAAAAIIYDSAAGSLDSSWTLGGTGNWIPAVQVTQASGQAMIAALPNTGTATATVVHWRNPAAAYQFLSGTSMAAPHVTGAVAFAAQNFPDESLAQRIARILNHTTPVPALAGRTVSGGRLNLLAIVDTDGDGLPDWWETSRFGNLSPGADSDPDGDGFSNAEEFLAGTDPTDRASHLAFASYGPAASATGDFSLSFPSIADRIYQVEWSDSLQSDSWTPLGTAVRGTGAPIEVIDTGAFSQFPRRFYRLQVSSE